MVHGAMIPCLTLWQWAQARWDFVFQSNVAQCCRVCGALLFGRIPHGVFADICLYSRWASVAHTDGSMRLARGAPVSRQVRKAATVMWSIIIGRGQHLRSDAIQFHMI
mmetsp:Transcript_59683/g.155237  ORF Transcript_59683/g.155237 Transcript_59683/m.155237 type:complete len:108 (-) Transcript_59683:49-372(-)